MRVHGQRPSQSAHCRPVHVVAACVALHLHKGRHVGNSSVAQDGLHVDATNTRLPGHLYLLMAQGIKKEPDDVPELAGRQGAQVLKQLRFRLAAGSFDGQVEWADLGLD